MRNLKQFKPYWQVMRFNKPEGSLLLLWPTFWALWIANQGMPSLFLLIIFTLGVIVMRAAGCVINDIADRKVDGQVKRTQNRPIANGQLKTQQAIFVFLGLCCIALVLVSQLNKLSLMLSSVGLLLACIYPFCKRFTNWPQVVLGAAFNWGIVLAFAASLNSLPQITWLVYTIGLVWTVAYDTVYAMVDYQDDIKIGIKSSAVGLGDMVIVGVTVLYTLFVIGIVMLGLQLQASIFYYLILIPIIILISLQLKLIQSKDEVKCFQAFKLNNWLGLLVLVGIIAN